MSKAEFYDALAAELEENVEHRKNVKCLSDSPDISRWNLMRSRRYRRKAKRLRFYAKVRSKLARLIFRKG
jgi:hypothetical protein